MKHHKYLFQSEGLRTKLCRLSKKTRDIINYVWIGVWDDSSKSIIVRLIKTLNLSVRTFLNSELQSKAAALTYNIVLSIVPLMALLFAIGRGFGLQDILEKQMFEYFPAQHEAIKWAFGFVDSYLKQASGGIFVGVGIIFLFWSLISLLGAIEKNFNSIWGQRVNRSLFRKITDYTAVVVLIPVLIICSSGLSIFMSNSIQGFFKIEILSIWLSRLLDLSPLVLTCLAFTLSFYIIPNTKVKFKYAAISGIISGVAFQILQYLFVSGQMYVSKYNAIYGSFAFLPLLLIWLQLSWLIALFGCALTYASQNVFRLNFAEEYSDISIRSRQYLITVVMAVCVQRFSKGDTPLTIEQISELYNLPIPHVTMTVEKLHRVGLVNDVVVSKDSIAIAPALDCHNLTIGRLLKIMSNVGDNHHMPEFTKQYSKLVSVMRPLLDNAFDCDRLLIKDLPLPNPDARK